MMAPKERDNLLNTLVRRRGTPPLRACWKDFTEEGCKLALWNGRTWIGLKGRESTYTRQNGTWEAKIQGVL